MNYLAHLYLAGPDPEARIGNLMGDFVKGPVPDDLPDAWRSGILLHRRIDSYTDHHPVVLRSKRRIGPPFRRYGGILIDLFYDHLLTRQWVRYHDQPLDDFVHDVHRLIERRLPELPPLMQRSMHYLLATDLLLAYRELDGIARALAGLERRLSRPSNLGAARVELERHYDALDEDFAAFFPELIAYTEGQRRQLNIKP
jgi:acyl carrier protein phosphodiesterase